MLKYKIVCAELHVDMLCIRGHDPSGGGGVSAGYAEYSTA